MVYSDSQVSENIINFLLSTVIYLSYVNLTIQLSQFDQYPRRILPVQVFWRTQVKYSDLVTPQTLTTAHYNVTTPDVWATPGGYFRCVCALAWITDSNYVCAKLTGDR